jgi:hypothetical protein
MPEAALRVVCHRHLSLKCLQLTKAICLAYGTILM